MSTKDLIAAEGSGAGAVAEPGAMRLVARRMSQWQSRYPLIQVMALIVIVLYGAASIPGYGSASSLKAMAVLAALLGLAALPQTLVALVGGIDFSIPGFITAGGVITVVLTGEHHWAMYAVIPVIIVSCAAAGALSGFVCHRFAANPLVITLGMYAVVQGVVLVCTSGNITEAPPTSLSRWAAVDGTTLGIGIPAVVVIWAVVAIVTGLALSRTPAGRRLYATGTNLRAARLALVRTELVWTVVFMLSAILSGLAGVLICGYSGGASPTMGDPYLFQGLTAVIVGGTAIGRSHGDYWRTVLGSLILITLTTVFVGKGLSGTKTQITFGFLILVVVAGYGRQRRLQDRV
jgi:ribose transport system permease protein